MKFSLQSILFAVLFVAMVGCGPKSETTDLGAMDPNEDMGMEAEEIAPVNAPASEV